MASERGEWMEVEGRPFESGLGYVPEDDFWDIAKSVWNQARKVNPQNPEAVIGQIEAAMNLIDYYRQIGDEESQIVWKAITKGPSDAERK